MKVHYLARSELFLNIANDVGTLYDAILSHKTGLYDNPNSHSTKQAFIEELANEPPSTHAMFLLDNYLPNEKHMHLHLPQNDPLLTPNSLHKLYPDRTFSFSYGSFIDALLEQLKLHDELVIGALDYQSGDRAAFLYFTQKEIQAPQLKILDDYQAVQTPEKVCHIACSIPPDEKSLTWQHDILTKVLPKDMAFKQSNNNIWLNPYHSCGDLGVTDTPINIALAAYAAKQNAEHNQSLFFDPKSNHPYFGLFEFL